MSSGALLAVLNRLADSLETIAKAPEVSRQHYELQQKKLTKFWLVAAADKRYPNLRAMVTAADGLTQDIVDCICECEDSVAVTHYVCQPSNKEILIKFAGMSPKEISAELRHIERRVKLIGAPSAVTKQ